MARTRSNRSGFEQRLLRAMRNSGVQPGDRLTVAFSGGVDSLALAAGLARVSPLLGTQIRIIHVDHQIRDNSQRDAAACRQLAAALGLQIDVVTLEAGLRRRTVGIGLEEAARRERYLALAAAANDWESSTIVLGHQANDQVETMLLHLVRGAGLDGIAGMRPVEHRPVPWWVPEATEVRNLTLLRPMLAESRTAIEAYVALLGLSPVADESNAETDFDRNWMRLRVLPEILKRWPHAVETIARSSVVLDADRSSMHRAGDLAYHRAENADRTLCTDTLSRLEPAVANRVLRRWLEWFGLAEVDLDVVHRLRALATDGDESRVEEAGSRCSIVVDGNRLVRFDQLMHEVAASIPIDAGDGWIIEIRDDPRPGDVTFDAPAGLPLEVRSIRQGDRWHGTNDSVMEDLRAAGVHPLVRTHVLAVASPAGVLLIPAIYPTIRGKVDEGSGKKAGVRWRRRS